MAKAPTADGSGSIPAEKCNVYNRKQNFNAHTMYPFIIIFIIKSSPYVDLNRISSIIQKFIRQKGCLKSHGLPCADQILNVRTTHDLLFCHMCWPLLKYKILIYLLATFIIIPNKPHTKGRKFIIDATSVLK